MRCVSRIAERAAIPAGGPERSGVLFRLISSGKGCGGVEGSGVDAYIVSGICAWARACSRRARCSTW